MQAARVTSGAGRKRTTTAREKIAQSVAAPVKDETAAAGGYTSDSSSESTTSSGGSSSGGGSSSSGSSGSSTTVDEGNGAPSTTTNLESLFSDDEYGKFFSVSCAENEAKFYLKRFARGSVGKCILFKGRWVTPNEFQSISGRKSSKDWKRSIRLRGRILKEFITQGLFQEHNKTCVCKICSGEDVEMLKQEGEMALAAKRRRLSQAESHPPASIDTQSSLRVPPAIANNVMMSPRGSNSVPSSLANNVSPSITVPPPLSNSTPRPSDRTSSGNGSGKVTPPTATVGKGRGRKTPVKLDPVEQREGASPSPNKIWSPSGEVAPNSASSTEEEYKPNTLPAATQPTSSTTGVVDATDFIPRRSRRSTHRKHNGHRTELGTFTHKPSQWDTEEVSEFLQLQGYGNYSESFSNNEIDGQSMFLLREQHLMERFQMKLGPALTLIDTISRLRHPPPY